MNLSRVSDLSDPSLLEGEMLEPGSREYSSSFP
jgi:hypothetical protein